jgi:hypothetical protein
MDLSDGVTRGRAAMRADSGSTETDSRYSSTVTKSVAMTEATAAIENPTSVSICRRQLTVSPAAKLVSSPLPAEPVADFTSG